MPSHTEASTKECEITKNYIAKAMPA